MRPSVEFFCATWVKTVFHSFALAFTSLRFTSQSPATATHEQNGRREDHPRALQARVEDERERARLGAHAEELRRRPHRHPLPQVRHQLQDHRAHARRGPRLRRPVAGVFIDLRVGVVYYCSILLSTPVFHV